MLIVTDRDNLGDKRLSPVEGVAKKVEETLKDTQKFAIPNQDLLSNFDMAIGNRMTPQEFIRRLNLMDPTILVEKGGMKDAVALRITVLDDDPTSPTHNKYVKKYVSGFYVDQPLNEYSSVSVENDGKARRENRGWRTVLLMLEGQKVVSHARVVKFFGEAQGQRSVLWRQQTQERRV